MNWLYILLLTNLAMLTFVLKYLRYRTTSAVRHVMLEDIVTLELAWAVFLFLFGLFIIFNKMEATRGEVLLSIVADKGTLRFLLVLFGFGLVHCSVAAMIISRLMRRRKV